MTVATLPRPTAPPPIAASPVPTLRIGQRELTPEQVFRYLSTSKLLPQFIRDIVLEDALQEVSYTVEELNAAVQGIAQQRQYQNLDAKSLSLLALRSLRVEKFKVQSWGNNLESYFLKRRQDLDQVVCSLIQTPDASLAQELYFRIQHQEDSFERLAQQYSQSAETREGGKLGPLPLSQLHPEIAKHLRGLRAGQVAPVFILGQQCIIIRLDKLIPAQLTETMRQTLLNELFENWLEHESAKELGLIVPALIQDRAPLPVDSIKEQTPSPTIDFPPVEAPPQPAPKTLVPVSKAQKQTADPQPRYALEIPSRRRRSRTSRRSAVPIAASVIGGILVAGVSASYWAAHEEAVDATSFSASVQVQTQVQQNLVQRAYDQAITAATLTQMAQTSEQWNQVIQHWQAALLVLSTIPENHPQFQLAQDKQVEYRRNLEYAEQQQLTAQDPFRLAVEAATAAADQGQNAREDDQWLGIATLWKAAMEGMQAVSTDHPRYQIAQQRIPIYQANLEYAEYRSQRAAFN
ncbi:MAG: peptidylprolyl isomerase [Prochlorotrichaceae cyanobacterium]